MAANILREFLIAIGFKVDEQSYRNFQNRFNSTVEQFKTLGKVATASAAAISTSVIATASNMEKLYFAAQRAGSSASGLQALQFAAEQVGIGADQVTSSVQGMASAVRSNPGLVTFFKSLGLNYDTKDTIKDFTNLLQALSRLSARGPGGHFLATQIAQQFGIDEQTLTLYEKNLPELLADLSKFQAQQKSGQAGLFTDDQIKKFHEFMADFRAFEIDLERLAITFGGEILPYADKIVKDMKAAVDWAIQLDHKTGGKSTVIGGSAIAVGSGIAAKKILGGIFGGGGATAAEGGAEAAGGGLALPLTASIAAGVLLASKKGGQNDPVLSLVKKLEGYSGTAYRDIAGRLTIGYGHLVQRGENFAGGITQAGAMKLLSSDTASALATIQRLVKVGLNTNQLAALTDFVFNIGGGAFSRSTLLKDLNAGNFSGAADEFLRWNKVHTASGAVATSNTLTNRRLGDRALFLKPDVNINQTTTIHVTGGDSAKETGNAVANQQKRVNGDLVRNMSGALQ